MDALLKMEKINKQRAALTYSAVSRTSFGSLLQSISEIDDKAEQDQSTSKYSTPKSKYFDTKVKEPQQNSRFFANQKKSIRDKKIPFVKKQFQTDNSSVSEQTQNEKRVLRTYFGQRQRNQDAIRKWDTDALNQKRVRSSSFEDLDSSFDMSEQEAQQFQSVSSQEKDKHKIGQKNFQKTENDRAKKQIPQRLRSNSNQNILSSKEQKLISNQVVRKKFMNKSNQSNKIKEQLKKNASLVSASKMNVQRQLKQKPFSTLTNKNVIGLSNSSGLVSHQGRIINRQQQIGSIRSDFDSKTSNLSRNSPSKSYRPVTGRRGDIVREYTIAVLQYCSHQIGMACYNNTTGEFFLCQLVQNMTYFRTLSTIQMFSPLEIIYPQTFEKTLLIKKLHEKFRQITLKGVYRRFFDEEAGYKLYLQTSAHQDLSSTSKFLAFASYNALIIHLQQNSDKKFKQQSLNVKLHRLDQLLIIEPDAISDLQIFYNYDSKKNKKCFIENFNCITAGGTRMLRANLLQPSSQQKIILQRQNLVQKLLQNPSLVSALEKELYKYKYYEPVTARFVQSPKEQNFKSLKSYLSSIFMLSKQCLSLQILYKSLEEKNAFQLPIFNKMDQKLQGQKLKLLRTIIQQNFDDNIIKNFDQIKNKKDKYIFLFKVQKIQDEFAEVTRTSYYQTIETIKNYFNSIKKKTKYEIHLMHNQNRGYFIKTLDTVDLNNLTQSLQQNLGQISGRGKIVTFSTQILTSLNNRLKETQKILILQSQTLLRKVICQIQQNIDILFQINQILSTIDMVIAFVKYIDIFSGVVKFTKPKFSKQTNLLHIQKLKPIWTLDSQKFQHELEDISLLGKNQNKNVVILQKSPNSIQQATYMTSMAYTVILSQIGCFVPAQKVEIGLFESMLSKIQLRQNTQLQMSRFQLNLVKVQNIMDNCFVKNQGKALVLMDQIVRGTQHEEQCALSLSIIQELQKNKGLSFLITSDRMLIKFLSFYDEFKGLKIIRTNNSQLEHQAVDEITKQSVRIMKDLNFDRDFVQSFQEIQVQPSYIKTQPN